MRGLRISLLIPWENSESADHSKITKIMELTQYVVTDRKLMLLKKKKLLTVSIPEISQTFVKRQQSKECNKNY